MRFFRCLAVLFLLIVPAVVRAQREKLPPEDLEVVQKTWPNAKRTATGLRYVVLAEGKGELAKPGDLVSVLYTGWLLDGTKFDQSIDRTKPFEFRLGRSLVIEGWDQGLQLMRPGERRLLIVPFELGYGSLGQRPAIPPRATLVFEVELLGVKKLQPSH
jgi:FKBP-type peptidyl-prolyl cis-trans isomerase